MKFPTITPAIKISSIRLVIIAVTAIWIKTLFVLFLGFDLKIISAVEIPFIMISPIGSLLLLFGFSFYFTKSFKPFLFWTAWVVANALLYGDLLYYRFYTDFVTLPILFQFSNVGGLGPSTVELMSPWDLLLFSDLFILPWIMRTRTQKGTLINTRVKVLYAAAGALLVLFTVGIGLLRSPYLFAASYDRDGMVKAIGPYNYHLFDFALGAVTPLNRTFATKTDANHTVDYLKSKKGSKTDLFGAASEKNLVLISMESTQNFVINREINGEEITPFLNDLIEDSFYFSNVYDQTAQGKTSDSEFMIDTGLYPLASGSVFVQKPENTYYSLPHILKERDYYTSVFHGNEKTFWNREKMYNALGYDRFYSEREYDVTEENSVNYGIKDIEFFSQTADKLEELPQPFYSRLITLTNHFPFLLEEEDKYIKEADTEVEVVNRYITTVRYQDEAIKKLFKDLKEKGLYDNTMFVLYGDHYGISEKFEEGIYEILGKEASPVNHVSLQQVPLIIHIPGQEGGLVTRAGGEIDIRPTILHLLGIKTENKLSFGHVLFTRDEEHPVIFRDGSFVTEDLTFNDGICYENTDEKVVPVKCIPYKETVRRELELSDDIIYGDLLRFLE
ncbi:LTA synthase family protein [Rossellomorea vietnamensis]|uniref:LTA synthase family protein n=1 Tax=Rossellomorea vietnamensis TaxID=218284 RepID=A0A5D4MF55_9BACI|nr:LTA synthase family protein [Rossellomorea vietnamensis]TYS00333.1 LTA synthase family protein [Rossellomorea vietnamensis]